MNRIDHANSVQKVWAGAAQTDWSVYVQFRSGIFYSKVGASCLQIINKVKIIDIAVLVIVKLNKNEIHLLHSSEWDRNIWPRALKCSRNIITSTGIGVHGSPKWGNKDIVIGLSGITEMEYIDMRLCRSMHNETAFCKIILVHINTCCLFTQNQSFQKRLCHPLFIHFVGYVLSICGLLHAFTIIVCIFWLHFFASVQANTNLQIHFIEQTIYFNLFFASFEICVLKKYAWWILNHINVKHSFWTNWFKHWWNPIKKFLFSMLSKWIHFLLLIISNQILFWYTTNKWIICFQQYFFYFFTKKKSSSNPTFWNSYSLKFKKLKYNYKNKWK